MSVDHEMQEKSIVENEKYDVQTEGFELKIAGFWTRFWAYLIDLTVIYSVGGLFVKPIFRVIDIPVSNPSFLFFTPYKITMLVVFMLYFMLMTKYFHQTIGKIILGIKVVPQKGSKLSWGTLFFREVVGRFISKVLLLPYLLVVFMPKKEALHDIFADTYVVHENAYERRKYGHERSLNNYRGEQLQEGPLV